jgi:hypothetical protein
MQTWQWMDVIGASSILAGLFLQFFIAFSLERDVAESEDAIAEMRLKHIYSLVKDRVELANPPWDKVRDFYAPTGPGMLSFAAALRLVKVLAAALFIVGGVLTVASKAVQYHVAGPAQATPAPAAQAARPRSTQGAPAPGR